MNRLPVIVVTILFSPLALAQGGKLWLGGAAPEALAMPMMPPGAPISIAADRKSFTMKGAENWVWTYTPTLVQ